MSNNSKMASGASTTERYLYERSGPGNQWGTQFPNDGSYRQKSYHSVQRPWSAPAVLHTQNEQRPRAGPQVSPMMQRWTTESMRNQPWNGVAGYYTSPSARK